MKAFLGTAEQCVHSYRAASMPVDSKLCWILNSWSDKRSSLKMSPRALGNCAWHFSPFADTLYRLNDSSVN